MERDNQDCPAPIDLGAASVETKGQPGFQVELSVIGKANGIDDE
jgi:hypothetical protein